MEARRRLERFARALRRRQRVRHALRSCLAAVAAVSIACLAVSALVWLDLLRFAWSAGHVAVSILSAALVAGMAGALVPVRTVRVLAEADRRITGDDALVTAHEFAESDEPMCRLLLQHAAAAIARAPVRKALPLETSRTGALAPLLLALALAAGALARDAQGGGGSDAVPVEPAVRALSAGVRRIASSMLAEHGPAGAVTVRQAERLLAIDRDLRQGRLAPDAARQSLISLLESVGTEQRRKPGDDATDAGSTGASAAEGERWRRDLALLLDATSAGAVGTGPTGMPDPVRASERSGALEPGALPPSGTAGRGAGAGLGAADPPLVARAGARSRDGLPRAGAAWSLPAPASPTETAGPGGSLDAGASPPPARAPRARGEVVPAAPRRPLTDSERAVVEAYFAALARLEAAPREVSSE